MELHSQNRRTRGEEKSPELARARISRFVISVGEVEAAVLAPKSRALETAQRPA